MTLPLTEHPSWLRRDSSKLDDYIMCPRRFLLRHIFGWELARPSHDLYFGECWHRAREHQLLFGYNDINGAYDKFITHYRKVFAPEDDSMHEPKTPPNVLGALMKFASEKHRDLIDNEVVILDGTKMTEISGTVPVSETQVLHYRMDSIMRQLGDGKVFSWDHKTTSEKYIKYDTWADQFYLGIQNGTYTHCLYCMFPIEEVLGIEFCGTGFAYLKRASKDRSAGYHCTLRRVPAYKTPDQMNVWLWTVLDTLADIDRDMDRLFHCSEDDPVLQAFKMNHKSCSMYKGCQFFDYCLSWGNPLQYCYEPPLGFKVDFWDPSKMETTNKRNLEWTM